MGHGHSGHGGFHGGHHGWGGRGGWGGGWGGDWNGWGWPEYGVPYAVPCFYDAAGNCVPLSPESVSGFHRGHVYERTSQMAPGQVPAVFQTFLDRPSLTPVKVELRLGELALACVVEVDGKLYGGAADLTQVWHEAKRYLREYHDELHRQGIPLVGCAVPPEDVAARIATDAVQKVGHELVSCCLAGWWSDLKKDLKGAEKDISHYALHPSDIVRDAGKAIGLPKSVSNALSYATDPLQAVTENAMVQKAAAGYFGGPAGAAALNAAQQAEQGNLSLSSALQAATPVLQQFGAPADVTSALSTVQQDWKQAQQYGQQAQQAIANPAQFAQNLAQPYVQQATQAAQSAVQDATSAATQAASQAAQDATGALQGALSDATGDATQLAQQIPDLAQVSGQIPPRELASKAAQQDPRRVVGVVQLADSSWKVVGFADSDAADDWFGNVIGLGPDVFWYVAYYDKGDPTFPGPLNEQASQKAPHVSGALGALALLATGVAAGMYGPDVYRWGRAEWDRHAGQLHAPAPHP